MLKVQGSLWCYSNLSPILIQPSLDAQSLCTLHSDCAKKSTYANMWSLDGSLAGACWMSTAGSWSSFFCSDKVCSIWKQTVICEFLPFQPMKKAPQWELNSQPVVNTQGQLLTTMLNLIYESNSFDSKLILLGDNIGCWFSKRAMINSLGINCSLLMKNFKIQNFSWMSGDLHLLLKRFSRELL